MPRALAFRFGLLVCLYAIAARLDAAPQADLFVATNGNDAWSGRLDQPNDARADGPLATLERARQLVRELKAREPQRQKPIVVAIRGGTYFLAQAAGLRAGRLRHAGRADRLSRPMAMSDRSSAAARVSPAGKSVPTAVGKPSSTR